MEIGKIANYKLGLHKSIFQNKLNGVGSLNNYRTLVKVVFITFEN